MSATQSPPSSVVPEPDTGVPESDEAAEAASGSRQVRKAAMDGLRWLSLSSGIAQVVGIGSAVVLTRLISPSQFGRLAVAVIVNEFAVMIANETIGTPLVQRADVEQEHLEAATLAALLLGFALAAFTFFVIPLITTPLFGAQTTVLFRLFAVGFLISGVLIVPLARLQRALQFRRIAVGEVMAGLICAVVSVALALAGWGAKAYVMGLLAGFVTMAVVYLTGVSLVRPRWRPRHMRDLLSFGVPAVAAGFAGVWYRNIDYMILGVRLPAASVGFYYRAYTLGVEYERRLSGIVARIAFPLYARTGDAAERLDIRERIVRLNAAVVYPMLAMFIAIAPLLVPWLFGSRWAPAVLPAQILAVAGMASCIRNLTAPTVLAAGRPSAQFVFSGVETVLYGGTVWIASSHGLVTVCIAVSAFQIISLLLAYTVLLRSAVGVPRTQILRDLGPALLASTVMFLISTSLTHALGGELPAGAVCLLVGATGSAIYVMALRALSAPSWNDLGLVVRRVLPSRVARAVRLESPS